MVIKPLPTQDGGSDSGSYIEDNDVYVIRLTPMGRYSMQEVIDEVLAPNEEILKWLISREISPVEHFHIVIRTQPSVEARELFKQFVYLYWPVRPRGFGNAQYNIQVATSEDKAISYAMKDKDYQSDGYTDEYLEERLKESFQKVSNYKTEYITLCKGYQEGSMTDHSFKVEMMKLKAKYGLKIILGDIQGYLLSNKVLKNPEYAEFLSNQL